MFVVGCYALCRFGGAAWPRFFVQFAVATALGGLLAAVQLLPFLDYLVHSTIIVLRHPGIPRSTLPLRAAFTLLIPNYFGSAAFKNFWGPANSNEIASSVGILPLLVLSCAILGGWRRLGTKFFCAMALFSGAVVYNFWPVLWVLSKLPGFSRAANQRLILALMFSLAALCGIGVDVVLRSEPRSRARLLAGVIASFGLLVVISVAVPVADHREIIARGMVHFVARQWLMFVVLLSAAAYVTIRALRSHADVTALGITLVGIEFLSVLIFAASYNPIIKKEQFYPSTPALEYLRHDRDIFRVALPMLNLGAVYDLSDMSGYDAMTPLRLTEIFDATHKASGGWGNGPLYYRDNLNSRLTDFLNLKYVLLPPGAAKPGPKFVLAYDGPDARIFRNREVFPRAFLVSQARSCVGDGAAVTAIRSGHLDLRREVVLSDCVASPPAASTQAAGEIEVYEPERVVVRAIANAPGFLVLTDTYDPGWQVSLDGHDAPLLRADHAFRAVALGPGSHRVEFLYRPLAFRVGLVFSLGALVLMVALISLPSAFLP